MYMWFALYLISMLLAQTFRHAGTVVQFKSVSRSTKAHVRTIRKLSAEMFTSSIFVATVVGGWTHCKGTMITLTSSAPIENINRLFGLPTFFTVVSMETWWTFADVGVDVSSTRRSILTGRGQTFVYSCKQEVAKIVITHFKKCLENWCLGYKCIKNSRTPLFVMCLQCSKCQSSEYLCMSSRSSPE